MDLGSRWLGHSREKVDWSLVVRAEVKHFATREEALAEEAAAIRAERPRWNIQHNGRSRRWVPRTDEQRELLEATIAAFRAWQEARDAADAAEAAAWDLARRLRESGVPDLSMEREVPGLTKPTLNRRLGPRAGERD